MNTKTVKVPDDVKQIILNEMTFLEVNGQLVGRMPQLDRDTYVRVNKVLLALGGKWDRRKHIQGHVFTEDPRTQFEAIQENGKVEADLYFPTPPAVVDEMIALSVGPSPSPIRVLEPSAGEGAIVDALARHGLDQSLIDVIELHPRRRAILESKGYNVVGKDFMDFEPQPIYDCVLMNPPFEKQQDIDHVQRAFQCLKPGGRLVAIMSPSPFFTENSKAVAFRKWLDYLYPCVDWSELPAGTFKESGTMVQSRLIVIDRPRTERECGRCEERRP